MIQIKKSLWVNMILGKRMDVTILHKSKDLNIEANLINEYSKELNLVNIENNK